jgi:hypothetical protein
MMQVTLHTTPRWRDVVLEQVRIVGLSLRREALVAAVVLGIVTVVIAFDIVRGTAESWFDSNDWAPIAIAAFLLPFAIWRRDRRFGPAFLWTLPVERRRLALMKVFAGWVWLMAALMVIVFWQTALAVLSRVPGAETVPLFVFVGVTSTYLFGSALVLGLRHPLRWLIGTVSVLFFLGALNQLLGREPAGLGMLLSSPLFGSAIRNAGAVWGSLGDPAQCAITTILSIGAGLAALWTAASRHAERRRH